MPFTFEPQAIPEVVHITPQQFSDERGRFAELFKQSDFAAHSIPTSFVQVNQSLSRHGVLRGLHYQNPPHAQAKVVMVGSGEIFDVAVDIRPGSKTYGQWVAVTLSAEKKNMLYVPEGFAHGFCVLSEQAEVLYFCTSEYNPKSEAGIIWNDPTLAITWPTASPTLSAKDLALPAL